MEMVMAVDVSKVNTGLFHLVELRFHLGLDLAGEAAFSTSNR